MNAFIKMNGNISLIQKNIFAPKDEFSIYESFKVLKFLKCVNYWNQCTFPIFYHNLLLEAHNCP